MEELNNTFQDKMKDDYIFYIKDLLKFEKRKNKIKKEVSLDGTQTTYLRTSDSMYVKKTKANVEQIIAFVPLYDDKESPKVFLDLFRYSKSIVDEKGNSCKGDTFVGSILREEDNDFSKIKIFVKEDETCLEKQLYYKAKNLIEENYIEYMSNKEQSNFAKQSLTE